MSPTKPWHGWWTTNPPLVDHRLCQRPADLPTNMWLVVHQLATNGALTWLVDHRPCRGPADKQPTCGWWSTNMPPTRPWHGWWTTDRVNAQRTNHQRCLDTVGGPPTVPWHGWWTTNLRLVGHRPCQGPAYYLLALNLISEWLPTQKNLKKFINYPQCSSFLFQLVSCQNSSDRFRFH